MLFDSKVADSFISKDRYTGVLLFVSNDKEAVQWSSVEFAKRVLHLKPSDIQANLKVFNPLKTYSLETVMDFMEFESKRAVGTKAKALILNDVDLLGVFADKILKTIEEPQDDSLIIMNTTNLFTVLPTIRSRSFIFEDYVTKEDHFVTFKNKYLSFLSNENFPNDEDVKNLINLGLFNVVQAMFANFSEKRDLEIAHNVSKMLHFSMKQENIALYILYSFYKRKLK